MNPLVAARIALALLLAATLLLYGCGDGPGPDTPAEGAGAPAADSAAAADAPTGPPAIERPATRTDTIRIEGTPLAIELRLFTAPDGFPLPFTAYVPEDMAAEADPGGTARFTAEFGGRRSPDAFVHLMVHPAGTDRRMAVATARAYKTGRGVPVSQGLEPLAGELRPPHLAWAIEAYRFGYQAEGGWFMGTIGVGRHDGRFFQVVRHYPGDYGDGFAPRAARILESWRWADGTGLGSGSAAPGPSADPPTSGPAPGDSTAP